MDGFGLILLFEPFAVFPKKSEPEIYLCLPTICIKATLRDVWECESANPKKIEHYLLPILSHSCSAFTISSALSKVTEPFGKIDSFSRKLLLVFVTFRGLTFQLNTFRCNPSNP
jgi:hypothetical protein